MEFSASRRSDKVLGGRKVAILVANAGVEQVELTSPRAALEEAGAEVEVVAPEPGTVQAFDGLDRSDEIPVDHPISEAIFGEYDALMLPGGVINADKLRTDDQAIKFVQSFVENGKPIGVICHGPWTLIEAGGVDDRKLTSWPSLITDIENAGGHWSDEAVINDHGLVSSRGPQDLGAFNAKIIEEFAEGVHPVHHPNGG